MELEEEEPEELVIVDDDEGFGDEDLGGEDLGVDDLGGEEEGAVDEFGEEPAVNIEIETPTQEINIEVDDQGNVEVETGEEEAMEDDLGEESPDYIGGEEDESLGDVAPDLEEDFGGEEESIEEEPEELDSAPLMDGHGHAPQQPQPHHAPSPEPEMSGYAEDEVKMLRSAALMNDKGFHSMSGSFGDSMNWDLIARAMGKNREQIRQEANQISRANAILESKKIDFNNPTDAIRRFLTTQTAASIDQSMPLDGANDPSDEHNINSGIPRKPDRAECRLSPGRWPMCGSAY